MELKENWKDVPRMLRQHELDKLIENWPIGRRINTLSRIEARIYGTEGKLGECPPHAQTAKAGKTQRTSQ